MFILAHLLICTAFSRITGSGFEESARPQTQQTPLILCDSNGVLRAGGTIPLSGEASRIGLAYYEGFSLFTSQRLVREKKNTFPYRLDIDVRDDGGDREKTAILIHELLKTRRLFVPLVGDETLEKELAPLIQKNKCTTLFPLAGIESPDTLFFRPTYVEELEALVDYAINDLKKERIAFFYEESSWGTTTLAGAEKALKKYGLTPVAKGAYQKGTVSIGGALKAIKKASPQAIICIAQGRPAYHFIKNAVNQDLHYVHFLGISLLGGLRTHLARSRGRGINFTSSTVVPHPQKSSLQIAAEYREDMAKVLPNKRLTQFGLEGYITAALLAYALDTLTYPSATITDLIQAAGQLRGQFKGLLLTGENNRLSHSIWIDRGDATEWIRAASARVSIQAITPPLPALTPVFISAQQKTGGTPA